MPIHRLLLLLLLGLALLTPLPTTAQEDIRLLESSVASAFPSAITFRLRAQAPSHITRAEVRFATEQHACAPVETSGFANFTPSPQVSASWTWDLRKGGSLPPGATVRYRWLLEGQAGLALDTPWQTFQAQDTRHSWRQVSRDAIRLYWYQGDDAFAAALLDSAQEAMARLEALAQLTPTGPLSLYIYASGQDLQDTLVFPEEWTGGVAYTGFNAIAIGIAPNSLSWGRRAVAHEVTHVLLDQATFNCLGHLPTWFNEGLATYNEDSSGQVQEGYAGPLQQGIRSGRLLSVPGLSRGFPSDAQDVLLAYGQSNSLAAYLAQTYGPERLRLLLDIFRRGAEADAALRAAYGFDQEGLDALWRAHVGAPAREAGAGGTRLPLPTPVLPAFEPYVLDTPTPAPATVPTIVATPTPTLAAVPTPTPVKAPPRGGCNGGLPSPTPTVAVTPTLVATPAATLAPLPTPTSTPTPTPSPTPFLVAATPLPTSTQVARNGELLAGVPRSQTLVLAEGEPRSLDPALSQDITSHQYVAHLFSGLVRLDEGLRLTPDLAESWETLDGGRRYLFHLRPNARFHSGRRITAQDVAYSLERATDPALDSPTAAAYLSDILGVTDRLVGVAQDINGVRVLDDTTLEIAIDGPKAYFLAKLAYPVAYVVDRDNVADGPQWWRAPNGSGPFRLKEWQPGRYLVLERNPAFHRSQQGVRYVAFRFLAGAPIRLYEGGEIDVAQVGAGSLPRILDPQSRLAGELRTYGELSIFYIGFNTARPPFDDPLVRRAFAMALEVDRLLEAGQEGYVQRAVGVLPPGMPGYAPEARGLPYDPAEARRLLAQSPYGGPAGLPPILYTSAGLDEVAPFLGAAAEMWRANLGVQISVRLIPTDDYFYRLSAEVDNLFDFGWIADYLDPENILDALFHTGAANNTGGYANPQVDALLEQARVEQAPGQRMELYRQTQHLLLQDAAAVPLWHGASYVLVKPYVQGYALTAQGVPTLETVWLRG